MPTECESYTAPRLTVAVPGVREFQRCYEQAVPLNPARDVGHLIERHAPWTEMLGLIADSAPHGFLIYWRNDVAPVMQLAGDQTDCIAYLMGNVTIAEQMYRYDARAIGRAKPRIAPRTAPQNGSAFCWSRSTDTNATR